MVLDLSQAFIVVSKTMKGRDWMFNFKTLKCGHCQSVIINLPESEVLKLNGSSLHCEICSHHNTLTGFELHLQPEGELHSPPFHFESNFNSSAK